MEAKRSVDNDATHLLNKRARSSASALTNTTSGTSFDVELAAEAAAVEVAKRHRPHAEPISPEKTSLSMAAR